MKWNLVAVALLAGGPLLNCSTFADEATVLAALQQAEERYKALSARVEDLEVAVQSYKQQVTDLRSELDSLKDSVAQGANNREVSGLKEDLDRLRQAIKEVDQRRIDDQERVTATIRELGKDLRKTLVDTTSSGPRTVTPNTARQGNPQSSPTKANGQETGYKYTIRSGDTLSAIVVALREQGILVTLKQVKDANPNVQWTRLKIGQEIFIPAPVP
jgi:LysM repeat protein